MPANGNWRSATSIYDFTVKDLNGDEVSLEDYRDHVCLIVNIASKCGLTATNFKELNELYDKYGKSKGLKILAFPSNQFAQEPGNSKEIKQYLETYQIKFDVFEKVDVNGAESHPLFKYLKNVQGGIFGDFLKWNFTKFLIDKNGQPVDRFAPTTNPKDIEESLEKYF